MTWRKTLASDPALAVGMKVWTCQFGASDGAEMGVFGFEPILVEES